MVYRQDEYQYSPNQDKVIEKRIKQKKKHQEKDLEANDD